MFKKKKKTKKWKLGKHPGGRPQLFSTVKVLEDKIQAYFDSCFEKWTVKKKKMIRQIRPFTITGLAVALNTTRDVLLDYEKNNKNFREFSNTIKKAKAKCEQYAEEHLFSGKVVTGAIFNLKNNYPRWKEEQDHNIKGQLSLTKLLEEADKKDGDRQ